MSEYAGMCMNISTSAWMVSVFERNHGLFFLKGQYLIFSKVAESIWFVFCFRLNIFANNNLDVAIVDFPYFVASSG